MAFTSTPPEQQSSYFPFPSRVGILRRPTAAAAAAAAPPPARAVIHPDVEPAPPAPRPAFQMLAFGLMFFFASLQFFLPATHFRDPNDPLRSWIPFDSSSHDDLSNLRNDEKRTTAFSENVIEDERVHIVSWMDCLDLRVLAVIVNSTLSSTRSPEHVYFHFFMPEVEDEKVSYYKLKVLFPQSDIDIIGRKEITENLRISRAEDGRAWLSVHGIAPFIISQIKPSLSRFIYISPNTIIKGSVAELFTADLSPHAIAAAEDCSKNLGDYVNIDVINALQRTAAKPWLSSKPYDENACVPHLNVLLIDAKRLEGNLIEAILWWSKVLSKGSERSDEINPSIILTLYDKYGKLSTSWKLPDSLSSQSDDETKVLGYDGPRSVCSENENQHQESVFGNVWQQYLSPKSELILNH